MAMTDIPIEVLRATVEHHKEAPRGDCPICCWQRERAKRKEYPCSKCPAMAVCDVYFDKCRNPEYAIAECEKAIAEIEKRKVKA